MAAYFVSSAAALIGQSTSTPVLGYLDPGSGSMLFQLVIASLLSSMFFARQSYYAVRSRIFGEKH